MSVEIRRNGSAFALTDSEITQVYFDCLRRMEKTGLSGDWRQWIADAYHCSGIWGQKMTEKEMLLELAETRRQADPDEYVPDIMLYAECTAYWNQLCEEYPD